MGDFDALAAHLVPIILQADGGRPHIGVIFQQAGSPALAGIGHGKTVGQGQGVGHGFQGVRSPDFQVFFLFQVVGELGEDRGGELQAVGQFRQIKGVQIEAVF
jgi:hypothetical protein